MPAVVFVHAVWMLLAVAAGTWSGYLGLLRATQGADGKSFLPGRFNLTVHRWTGVIYYVSLYMGIAGAMLMTDLLVGPWGGFWDFHKYLALAAAVVYAPAAWLGFGMLRRPPAGRARPVAHMVLNFTACTLVGVQIVLTVIKVWPMLR